MRVTMPRERSASASSSAMALIVSAVSILAPSSSQRRRAGGLAGVLVLEERGERPRPVAAHGLLDLHERGLALDEDEDPLVLPDRLAGAVRDEREDRVADVPEARPLGVDHLEQPRVGAPGVEDVVELLVEGGERARVEALERTGHHLVHGAGLAQVV